MSKERWKEIVSIPAIATYAGTGASMWAYLADYLFVSTVVLSSVVIVLFFTCIQIHQRSVRFKKFKMIDSDLRRLTHRTKEYTYHLRLANSEQEFKSLSAEALRDVVDAASMVFKILCEVECTVSVMLRVGGGRLATTLYSHNVDPRRKEQPSQPLSPDEGVASEAFRCQEAVVWTSGHRSFKQTRQNHADFYCSGVTVPFKVGGTNAGLLNIDSREEKKFNQKDHQYIATLFADCVALIIEMQQLREDLHV